MSTISIRGLDVPVVTALKQRAATESISVNTLVVRLLEEATGRRPRPDVEQTYHDLDHLFGTWSEEEYREFEASTARFGEIDAELWGRPGKER